MKMMIEKIKQIFKPKIIVIFALVYFFLANTLTLLEDIFEDEHAGTFHLVYEIILTAITMLALYVVLREILANRKNIKIIKNKLEKTSKSNKHYYKQIQILKNDLLQVINVQFSEWLLSESEKDIALLLLKGLSLEEISKVRKTKEKTIRQQASTIYRKSNLKGRHELSAYFFEDLL